MSNQIRRLARRLSRQQRQTRDLARASGAAYRSVELSDGPVIFYDEEGNPIYQIGEEPDGGVIGVPVNTPPPGQPTAPDAVGVTGGISITYDGTFVDANAPSDFSHYEIHASTDGPFTPTDETQIGSFTSVLGGTHLYPLAGGSARHVGIVAVNLAGVHGPLSVTDFAVSLEEPEITDGEAPTEAPVVAVRSGIQTLFITWDAIANNDPVTYTVFLGTSATLSGDDVVAVTDSTMVVTGNLPSGVLLEHDTTYYTMVVPQDADGMGPPSNVASGSPMQVHTEVIAPGAITEDQLSPGAVTTEKIAPHAVRSGNIADFSVPVIKFSDRKHRLY